MSYPTSPTSSSTSSSTPTSSATPPQTFHLFTSLPQELQDQIWDDAIIKTPRAQFLTIAPAAVHANSKMLRRREVTWHPPTRGRIGKDAAALLAAATAAPGAVYLSRTRHRPRHCVKDSDSNNDDDEVDVEEENHHDVDHDNNHDNNDSDDSGYIYNHGLWMACEDSQNRIRRHYSRLARTKAQTQTQTPQTQANISNNAALFPSKVELFSYVAAATPVSSATKAQDGMMTTTMTTTTTNENKKSTRNVFSIDTSRDLVCLRPHDTDEACAEWWWDDSISLVQSALDLAHVAVEFPDEKPYDLLPIHPMQTRRVFRDQTAIRTLYGFSIALSNLALSFIDCDQPGSKLWLVDYRLRRRDGVAAAEVVRTTPRASTPSLFPPPRHIFHSFSRTFVEVHPEDQALFADGSTDGWIQAWKWLQKVYVHSQLRREWSDVRKSVGVLSCELMSEEAWMRECAKRSG